jgi:hypothetical protein
MSTELIIVFLGMPVVAAAYACFVFWSLGGPRSKR